MNRIAAFISGNRKRALTVALAVLGIVLIIFSCRDDGAAEATTDLSEYKAITYEIFHNLPMKEN